jgi:hypothetical protein
MRGLVRRAGGPCGDLYEVAEAPGVCTHGPDRPLPGSGQAVGRRVAPLAPAQATTRSRSAAAAAVCEGDGSAGYRTEVLYVRASGTPDRYAQYLPSFRTWSEGVDTIINESAKQTGGERRVRFVHDASCSVVVRNVVVPSGATASFGASIDAVRAAGYSRTDRKYLMYVDATALCGVAGLVLDSSPGQGNANNGGPSYARVDSGCWGAGTAAHELVHALGAVMPGAPNISAAGHCTDDYDLMCYKDGPNVVMRIVCPDRADDDRLDCGNDDYFHTSPPAGSWLAAHWNTANNRFLIAGAGSGGGGGGGGGGTGASGPLRSSAAGTCVDVRSSGTADGTPVQLYGCNGTGAQAWTHATDGTLRALGKCLQPAGGSTANGAKLQLSNCTGSTAQRWTRTAATSAWVGTASGRCIDRPSSTTTSGTQLQVWDCNGTGAQRWSTPGGAAPAAAVAARPAGS